MSAHTRTKRRLGFSKGFTLIEVIATIVTAAILGVIFIQFMGTAMSRSVDPVDWVQGEAAAEAALERITADYVLRMNQDFETALELMRTDIDGGVYGANVTADYIVFDAAGLQVELVSGTSRTLRVTVAAAGVDLTTFLTASRDANAPPIAF
jgi:type II secretory pathway pseudopilin PulG